MSQQILIVDDSKTMRKMIARALRGSHLTEPTVLEAESAPEASAMLEANSVDLVFLDINMPGGNGIGLLQKMRATDKDAKTPVIVVSSDAGEERRKQIGELGAMVVPKPFSPEDLVAAVREVMGA